MNDLKKSLNTFEASPVVLEHINITTIKTRVNGKKIRIFINED